VQINGKLVNVVRVPADADSKAIEAAARADEKSSRALRARRWSRSSLFPASW